jgi:hypothetical protein
MPTCKLNCEMDSFIYSHSHGVHASVKQTSGVLEDVLQVEVGLEQRI